MNKKVRLLQTIFFYMILLTAPLFWPGAALAVQHHGGAEGLVSHQIGHILFFIGMVFLLYRLLREQANGSGWPEFKCFLLVIILWNIFTFCGHLLREVSTADKFIKNDGRVVGYVITDIGDLFFYLSRLDHLLLVPAFILLAVALHKWRAQP